MKKDGCKGAREDESMAGAGEHGKVLLDLGLEVRQWPLQLVLPMNRSLTFARKQRENSLFCDCGTEPVLPH